MSDDWEGQTPRQCREHRTVGYRAWCYDESMWCYPDDPCHGCLTDAQKTENAKQFLAARGFTVVEQEGGPYITQTGKVLTDDDIEELADEAERGYDVTHLLEDEDEPERPTPSCDGRDCGGQPHE